ncbi:MAG: hypothetical protein H6574_21515 [Lewinellaceae bacterium]|nr:hypothetical protein [Lewinellaceae bacterium]
MKIWKTTSLNLLVFILTFISCTNTQNKVPTVGFVDAFEDSTIAQAKAGFLDALKAGGFSEDAKTLNLVYRNAQGNIPTLTQIVQYFISQEVTLMATCPTLSTITALQNTKEIPIFMMVAPTPEIMGVKHTDGSLPPTCLV